MIYAVNALFFFVSLFLNLYIFILLLRFVLQKIRFNAQNPLFQFIKKVTEPLVKSLRSFIPVYQGFDLPILTVALVLEIVWVLLLVRFEFGIFPGIVGSLAVAVGKLGIKVSNIYFYAVIVYVIMSWVPALQKNYIAEIVYALIHPPLTVLRRHTPLIAGWDFSPLLLIIVVLLINLLVFNPIIKLGIKLAF